jgi:hypothetical protein
MQHFRANVQQWRKDKGKLQGAGKHSVDLKQMTLKRYGANGSLNSKIILKNLFAGVKTSLSLKFSTGGGGGTL